MLHRRQQNPRTATCNPLSRAGFTLTELLVVISVLIVLFSLGVGTFLSLKGPYAFKAQVALVRTTIRKARNYALTKGSSAKVVIDPIANEVRACGIRTSGHWSFESELNDDTTIVTSGAFGFHAEPKGAVWVIGGRFGSAYDFPDGSAAYMDCGDPGAGIWDDVTGIHFMCWIKPVDFKILDLGGDDDTSDSDDVTHESGLNTFVILEKGNVYSLSVVEDYSIEVIVGDLSVSGRIRTRPGIIFPNRWNKVEVTFDGRADNPLNRIQIATNGIENFELYTFDETTDEKIVFRTQENRTFVPDEVLDQLIPRRIPRSDEPLTISSKYSDLAFVGAIDEVSIGVVVSDTVATLREAKLMGKRQIIHFDKRGRLNALYHSEPVIIEITNDPHYRPPKEASEEDEFGYEDEDLEEDDMGIGPKIPRQPETPASESGNAANGPADPRTVPKKTGRAKRKGAIIKRIVIELTGNTSSRAQEEPAYSGDDDDTNPEDEPEDEDEEFPFGDDEE